MKELKLPNRRFGWKPDLPDARDHYFRLAAPLQFIPRHVNLSPGFPPVYDQGNLGSCTGNGISGAVGFDRIKNHDMPNFVPSRLFIYYNERVIEGTPGADSGASVRDGIQAITTYGVCSEALWPYDISKFADAPPAVVYAEAAKYKAVNYARVPQDMLSIKSVLASGYPIVFGFTVYESFMTEEVARTGMVPFPNLRSERTLGGHCVVLCGYNSNNLGMFRNSWGPGWGDPSFPGHGWMQPEMFLNPDIAADFWVIYSTSA